MTPELKSCPFCGGEAHFQPIQGNNPAPFAWDVIHYCEKRGFIRFDPRDDEFRGSKEMAVEAWNARAAPKVKPLVWVDFDGRGAKASGWRKANYLITKWSDGRFDLVESYPGYSGQYIDAPRYDTLEAAKAAAQADYERRILEALE